MRVSSFKKLSICALGYTLFVIVWGAFVRVTGSGAGCGSHWPTCNGEVVPRSASLETLIEFTHRLTSGAAGILSIVVLVAAYRAFPRGHAVRKFAWASLFFMATEGAVGAGLVIFERVADDTSTARGYWMSAHLVNTFMLVAVMTVTAALPFRSKAEEQSARMTRARKAPPAGPPDEVTSHESFTSQLPRAGLGALHGWRSALPLRPLFALTAVVFFATGITGAIAALGDTLFPSDSFVEGARQHLDPGAHVFIRLRILHPFVAVFTALVMLGVAGLVSMAPERRIARTAKLVGGLVVAQVCVGVVNLLLAAPAAMQLVHLLVGDLVWIAFVVLVTDVETVPPE